MSVMISMILLRQEVPPPIEAIERELRRRYPDLGISETAVDGNSATLKLKDADMVLMTLPAPIPWSDLEGPCSSSLLWKNATEEVRGHSAHLIVTLLTELNKVEQAILLTKVTTAVLAAADSAIGVYWCNATLVLPKPLFIEFTEQILPQGPPLDIWIDFRIGWQTPKTSGGFTQGLEALGHMEIETQESPEKPSDLRQRLHGLAGYLLENGPVIRDGHTIGQSAREKIRVVFTDSAFGTNKRVMRLEYDMAASKPWWKIW